MKIKALKDRVIVLDQKHNTTKSGIIIEEDADPNKVVIETVVDSGLDGVKTGDKVVYKKWGKQIILNEETGERYRVLGKDDVLAIYEE